MNRRNKMGDLFLTGEQSRAVDKYALERLGVPGVVLMENAGRGAAERVIEVAAARVESALFVVLTGSGNNAGDGFVVARHLACRGLEAVLVRATAAERLTGDARVMSEICVKLKLPTRMATEAGEWRDEWVGRERSLILIDALMGTGAQGAARPHFADLIRQCNRLRREREAFVAALDLPSGLDADSGEATDPTVEADLTLTFCTMKQGFGRPRTERYTGRVEVVGIGLPQEAIHASFKGV